MAVLSTPGCSCDPLFEDCEHCKPPSPQALLAQTDGLGGPATSVGNGGTINVSTSGTVHQQPSDQITGLDSRGGEVHSLTETAGMRAPPNMDFGTVPNNSGMGMNSNNMGVNNMPMDNTAMVMNTMVMNAMNNKNPAMNNMGFNNPGWNNMPMTFTGIDPATRQMIMASIPMITNKMGKKFSDLSEGEINKILGSYGVTIWDMMPHYVPNYPVMNPNNAGMNMNPNNAGMDMNFNNAGMNMNFNNAGMNMNPNNAGMNMNPNNAGMNMNFNNAGMNMDPNNTVMYTNLNNSTGVYLDATADETPLNDSEKAIWTTEPSTENFDYLVENILVEDFDTSNLGRHYELDTQDLFGTDSSSLDFTQEHNDLSNLLKGAPIPAADGVQFGQDDTSSSAAVGSVAPLHSAPANTEVQEISTAAWQAGQQRQQSAQGSSTQIAPVPQHATATQKQSVNQVGKQPIVQQVPSSRAQGSQKLSANQLGKQPVLDHLNSDDLQILAVNQLDSQPLEQRSFTSPVQNNSALSANQLGKQPVPRHSYSTPVQGIQTLSANQLGKQPVPRSSFSSPTGSTSSRKRDRPADIQIPHADPKRARIDTSGAVRPPFAAAAESNTIRGRAVKVLFKTKWEDMSLMEKARIILPMMMGKHPLEFEKEELNRGLSVGTIRQREALQKAMRLDDSVLANTQAQLNANAVQPAPPAAEMGPEDEMAALQKRMDELKAAQKAKIDEEKKKERARKQKIRREEKKKREAEEAAQKAAAEKAEKEAAENSRRVAEQNQMAAAIAQEQYQYAQQVQQQQPSQQDYINAYAQMGYAPAQPYQPPS